MCLNLDTIKVLYKFMHDSQDQFSSKQKQSVKVLTDDIKYMDKDLKIFSADDRHGLHDYYVIYKFVDKSAKIDQRQMQERFDFREPQGEDI